MKVEYGTPLPCPNCKSTNIHCRRSFGASGHLWLDVYDENTYIAKL